MAICKLHIPNLEFAKERTETIFESMGQLVQDFTDFSFIFSQICIAYISGTKPYMKNLNDKFGGINSYSKLVKFRRN